MIIFYRFSNVTLIVGLCLLGCGRDEPPPYVLNEAKVLRPGEGLGTGAPPGVEIVAPGDLAEFDPGQRIACAIELTVPEGGRAPVVVQVYLRKGTVSQGGPWHAIEREGSRGDGPRTLDAAFEAPRRPGRYTMQAVAIDNGVRRRPAGDDAGPSDEPEIETTRYHSEPITIVVRK